jgi:5'-nucleotidase (lipoprotein e(P4) family)
VNRTDLTEKSYTYLIGYLSKVKFISFLCLTALIIPKNEVEMKKLFLFALLPILISCKQNTSSNYADYNLDQEYLVYATVWFQHSPEAKSLYYQGFNIAKERVLKFKSEPCKKPKAVVVDLDETMINNSAFQGKMLEIGKYFSYELWDEWTSLAKADALPGAVEFTHFCDSVGVEVIYMSNRSIASIDSTMSNLKRLGFAFIKPENFLLKDSTSSKEPRRQKVSEKYNIILLLGDNLNDFSDVFEARGDDWGVAMVEKYREEFGHRFIVFPNPMYGEWEKNLYGYQNNLDKLSKFKKRREKIYSY